MSTNKVRGGVRTNARGIIVNGNGERLNEAQLQALPVKLKKVLGIKPKLKPRPKTKLPKPETFIKDSD